ncbi:MAG: HAD-IIB family hydrolase [Vagococcus sp.]
MTKKLVVFDIDGTLHNDQHKILPSTIEAITQLKKSGHKVMCATGRSYPLAVDVLKEAGLKDVILSNGAVAFLNEELVYSNPLDRDDMSRVIETCDKADVDVLYYSLMDTRLRQEKPKTETKMPLFAQNFPALKFARWHEYGVDILSEHVSKAETLKHVSNSLGIPQTDIVAFGDGRNDMEMIEYAGMGVAMGNAREELKVISNLVTDTNNKDGIYKALVKLGLVK